MPEHSPNTSPRDDSHDLESRVNSEVRQNQAPPTGETYLMDIDGCMHLFSYSKSEHRAERFGRILDSELDWIEKFTLHGPTIGNHHEEILRDILVEYLPDSMITGSGFVYDSARERASQQIDVLVYSSQQHSPIYRRGTFAIVDTADVLAVCEVKKRLTKANLVKCIRKAIPSNLGHAPLYPHGLQRYNIFAFHSTVATKILARTVADELAAFLENFASRTKGGNRVLLAIESMSLPAIFVRERDEFIKTSVSEDSDGNAAFEVEILEGLSSSGVPPFLSAMNPSQNNDINYRDFVTTTLYKPVKTILLDTVACLIRRLSSHDLLQRFSDAEQYLQIPSPGGDGKYIAKVGATVSSFVDLGGFDTLAELAAIRSFSWLTVDSPAAGPSGD